MTPLVERVRKVKNLNRFAAQCRAHARARFAGLGKNFWDLTKTKAVGPTMPIRTHATKTPGSLDTKTTAPRAEPNYS